MSNLYRLEWFVESTGVYKPVTEYMTLEDLIRMLNSPGQYYPESPFRLVDTDNIAVLYCTHESFWMIETFMTGLLTSSSSLP